MYFKSSRLKNGRILRIAHTAKTMTMGVCVEFQEGKKWQSRVSDISHESLDCCGVVYFKWIK